MELLMLLAFMAAGFPASGRPTVYSKSDPHMSALWIEHYGYPVPGDANRPRTPGRRRTTGRTTIQPAELRQGFPAWTTTCSSTTTRRTPALGRKASPLSMG